MISETSPDFAQPPKARAAQAKIIMIEFFMLTPFVYC
jgi:hypothetical protein